jgi:hypothetical protein
MAAQLLEQNFFWEDPSNSLLQLVHFINQIY